MLPKDFDREAICRSISDGVYRAFMEVLGERAGYSSPKEDLLYEVQEGVRGAIMTIMTSGGYPLTKEDVLEYIRKGVADTRWDEE